MGRLGGEEFGVFLPGSGTAQARATGERICKTINEAEFAPDGARRRLSVSVGGAIFLNAAGYRELYRLADQQLYRAKNSGRNNVSVAMVHRSVALAASAM